MPPTRARREVPRSGGSTNGRPALLSQVLRVLHFSIKTTESSVSFTVEQLPVQARPTTGLTTTMADSTSAGDSVLVSIWILQALELWFLTATLRDSTLTMAADPTACNYSPQAINDDGSCTVNDDCGVCGGDNSTCGGCTNPAACNFDPSALVDDGSCVLNGVVITMSLLTDNYLAKQHGMSRMTVKTSSLRKATLCWKSNQLYCHCLRSYWVLYPHC